jgi:hypothetical protein
MWRRAFQGRHQRPIHRQRFRPAVEFLEDRCLLATTYTWQGPANGAWSTNTNWNPNGKPTVGDTVIFNNTDNNDSKMDLTTGVSSRTVSVLKVDGYTGKIWLQRPLTVDVLTMSSGTILPDTNNLLQGNVNLYVQQDGNSSTFAASKWTGGEIGGGDTLSLHLGASEDHPLTFNLGSATATPKFSGGEFWNGTNCTVNWLQGNFVMAKSKTIVPQISNLGDFKAKSTGT